MWNPATPERPWSEGGQALPAAGVLPWAWPGGPSGPFLQESACVLPSLLPSSGFLPHQPTWRQVIKQEEGDGWMGRAESHVVP